jgi:hypothetical protein
VLTLDAGPDGRPEFRLGIAGAAGVARLAHAEHQLDVSMPSAEVFGAAARDAVERDFPECESLYGVSPARVASLFRDGFRALTGGQPAALRVRGTRIAVHLPKEAA